MFFQAGCLKWRRSNLERDISRLSSRTRGNIRSTILCISDFWFIFVFRQFLGSRCRIFLLSSLSLEVRVVQTKERFLAFFVLFWSVPKILPGIFFLLQVFLIFYGFWSRVFFVYPPFWYVNGLVTLVEPCIFLFLFLFIQLPGREIKEKVYIQCCMFLLFFRNGECSLLSFFARIFQMDLASFVFVFCSACLG